MTDNNKALPSNAWMSVVNDDDRSKHFIDQWTRAGLSKYVSLPMICVLGDTSSGKSSVLSSLIGLELPSGSTLTTKCPVLIQLHQGSRNEATIEIQWYDKKHDNNTDNSSSSSNGESLRQRKRSIEKQVEEMHRLSDLHVDEMKDDHATLLPPTSPTKPPPTWKPRTITSDLQTQVPQVLKEAQDFILNHRVDMLITPDVIRVSILSTQAERELTLIDLPGLVAYQHTHESSLLSQVEQVVLHHVHNPRSILVPVVAAPSNIHNSKVLQWCRQVDPTTMRTIPVLTKPDLIDPGSESDVAELLQDNAKFVHGFYMVKNRGQASLDSGTNISKGLEEEAEFFTSTSPWSDLSCNDRLGIPSLRTTLAAVLLKVMKDSLPDILGEIEEQFQAIDNAIDSWGERLLTKSEQRKFYHTLTQRLITNVSSSLSGKGPRGRKNGGETTSKPAGAALLHSACNDFLKQIKNGSLATISQLNEGTPVLVSTTNTAEDVRGEIVHIDHEAEFVCVDYVDVKDHTTDILFDAVGYTAENPDFDRDEVWSDGHRVFIGRESGLFDSLRKLPLNHVRTDPAWLIDKIAEYRTDDLACFINVEMFRNIVGEFVHDDWTPPCLDLLKTLENILNDALDQALQESFKQELTRYPLLKSMMEERCREACNRLLECSKQDVKAHLEIEENHPYTQDEVLLQTLSESRFRNLRRDLEIQLKLAQEGVVFDTQAITSILDTVFNKHKKLHWMAEQMELVLSSYGRVATQRVLDRTPQICWQTCRKLPGSLQECLGSVTDDILEKCLWESPESKEKYQDMVATLKDLQEAMEVVKNIQ
ncbi:dynamin central region-domain containing protein [Nitzschia inconspicua]|uniref:Dynamin central region-domain containing protein n=1 Tax=Nitzschia inconspicua TaxID=303405 RepID=A0A9K3KPE8_9STRA|nr:dynamin central region-domain containing protein [Nitzschia inconspicua]